MFHHFDFDHIQTITPITLRNINGEAEHISRDSDDGTGEVLHLNLPGNRSITILGEEFESLAYLFAHLADLEIKEEEVKSDDIPPVCDKCENPGYLTLTFDNQLFCQACHYERRNNVTAMK